MSNARRWHFLGCLAAEERSIEPLLALQRHALLESVQLARVRDLKPQDPELEGEEIGKRIAGCVAAGVMASPRPLDLDVRVNAMFWPEAFDFKGKASICLDISCLPKRFFFPLLRAAFLSPEVKDLLVLYAKPKGYPPGEISGDRDPWKTIDQFSLEDMAAESEAEKSLIISTGFMVGGLVEYLSGPKDELSLDLIIPFPAEPWDSVHRAWISARLIEDELRRGNAPRSPTYHRVPALDGAAAFDRLLSLTTFGRKPAALAPLGPKPTSMAMCLLASQTNRHPVYYAQPKTYAVNYSVGYEKTYAYWIKHDGENLYSVDNHPKQPNEFCEPSRT
jgi:hypothetical protein